METLTYRVYEKILFIGHLNIMMNILTFFPGHNFCDIFPIS